MLYTKINKKTRALDQLRRESNILFVSVARMTVQRALRIFQLSKTDMRLQSKLECSSKLVEQLKLSADSGYITATFLLYLDNKKYLCENNRKGLMLY